MIHNLLDHCHMNCLTSSNSSRIKFFCCCGRHFSDSYSNNAQILLDMRLFAHTIILRRYFM
ncbi:hypothetical protein DERF_009415 [Dermatophagoides farinae]|uniref:Uncharacterized protein n=1 Tax=Dermatophagoides farinae TaxID=6954 RepID=A0A922L403_DERFA|nr:hypothetical protein DERF_009415 [Dermatophagoides farinae]